MAEEYYNIGPEVNNIDFYLGGIQASSFTFITSDSEVSASAIRLATVSISIPVSTTSEAEKISYAQSNLSSSFSIAIVSTSILKSLIISHATTTVNVSTSKTAKASANISSSLSIAPFAIKITKDRANLSMSMSVSANPIKQSLGKTSISIHSTATSSVKEINLAYSSISILSRARIISPVRFSPNFIDGTSIRTLVVLDGKPLTNHNRELNIQESPVFVQNSNWNNRKSRYYKIADRSGRKTFSLSWSFLPNFMEKTVDSRHARDYISIVSEDPDVHVLKVINQDQNGLTPYTESTYNVFVRSYSETLIRRDLSDGVYYFDCSLTLEEA
jgi:hypothetical protein